MTRVGMNDCKAIVVVQIQYQRKSKPLLLVDILKNTYLPFGWFYGAYMHV